MVSCRSQPCNKEDKEIKVEHMLKKESKLAFSILMLFLNVDNSNLPTNKALKWLSKFRKITDYKVNMHKSIVFLFTAENN